VIFIVSLGSARGRGLLTDNEVQHYLDQGYTLEDEITIQSGRPGEMVTISYMDFDASHKWTVNAGESQLGFIGSKQDLTNAGEIVNNGEIMWQYTTGKIVNTGKITNTGLLTLKVLA
jgi:hypothetical protein